MATAADLAEVIMTARALVLALVTVVTVMVTAPVQAIAMETDADTVSATVSALVGELATDADADTALVMVMTKAGAVAPVTAMVNSRKNNNGGDKLNTEVMFSSATDLWSTPQEYFDDLSKEFPFTLDVCALPENAKCKKFYTPETDGLAQEWNGVCWMNPPYGRVIGKWIQKAYESAKAGAVVVGLLPARTDTKWFHNYIYGKAEIRFIRGRLKFGGCANSAPFPSMLVIWKN